MNLKSPVRGRVLFAWLLLIACALPVFAQKGQSDLRTLTGHVYDRQTKPVAKAVVYLKNTKSLVIKTYITDPDGSYRFPALSPNVDYEVYADHEGSRSDTKTLSAFDSRKAVNISLRLK